MTTEQAVSVTSPIEIARPGLAPFKIHFDRVSDCLTELVEKGTYDDYVFRALEHAPSLMATLRTGGVVIDIGANIGYYACVFSRWVGSDGRVFVSEPFEPTARMLTATLRANGMDNVKLLPLRPFAGRVQPVEMIQDHRDITQGTTRLLQKAPADTLETLTLDGAFGRLDRLDLLKVDVNGPDFEILLGGSDLIGRTRPHILIEFTPQEIEPETWRGALDLLRSTSYTPYFWRGHSHAGLEICSFEILEQFYELWRRQTPNSPWMNLLFHPKTR